MADEQNRLPEAQQPLSAQQSNEVNDAGAIAAAGDDPIAPEPPRRWFSRRNVIVAAIIPLALILIVALAAIFAFRFGYFGRYVEQNFVRQMDKVGLQSEIGKFETTLSPLGVIMRDVKLYDQVTGEQLVRVDYLKLDVTVVDLFALNFEREIRLDSTEVDGVELWVRFDEEGRSNFSRLRIPEQEESNLRFSYSTMRFNLRNALVHYGDVSRRISGDARNVALVIEPDEGLSETEREIENRRFKFDLASTASNFVYDDKRIEPIDVAVRGVATETYADIAALRLTSPVATSELTGRLENWQNLRYDLNVVSTVDLQQTGDIFQTGIALRGFGNFRGRVRGEGTRYTIENGEIVSDALAADNVRLRGLSATASVSGENTAYEANGQVVADLLTYGDFELNELQLAGEVMGTGTDLKFLGDLRAAAARLPGNSSIANLILSDAVAEYRDNRLIASAGSGSAQQFAGFDTRGGNIRFNAARVTNQNGVTDATVGNLRADRLETEAADLRGVTASNIRLRNRDGGATEVTVGALQAGEIAAEDARLQGVRAGNARLNVRGNRINGNVERLQAAGLQAQGANVRDLNAANVLIDRNGAATSVTAGRVQTSGVTRADIATGAVNAANVTATINPATTNVTAGNVQVAGVRTAQATLGSLNVGGVRLSIRGGRIEGASNDINAGNVTLARSRNLPEGGRVENLRLGRPTFVVEPSGRYRASSDLSLGGGVLGSVRVGAVRAAVVASSDQIQLNNLNAEVLEGQIVGNATVALNARGTSRVNADFNNLDVAKLLALQGGQVVPVAGKTTGTADLTFPGTNVRAASGTLTADFQAEAGSDERGRVPLTGRLDVRATNGLFNVEAANFRTAASEVTARGQFDLNGANSDLAVNLNSTDAGELQRLLVALNVAPELDAQLAANRVELAGNLNFNGNVRGSLTNPIVTGRAALDSLLVRGERLGSLAADLNVAPDAITINNGVLAQANGGTARFDVSIPGGGVGNNIAVNATLERVDAGRFLAAIPVEGLPDFLRTVRAETSGRINVTGLPNAPVGTVELSSGAGTIGGEPFDSFAANINLQNTLITINRFEIRSGEGLVTARGSYDGDNSIANLDARVSNLPIARLRGFLGEAAGGVPDITGTVDLTASARADVTLDPRTNNPGIDFSTAVITFDGTGREITLGDRALGDVAFVGRTQNQQLTANLTANFAGQQQVVTANLNFANESLPFRAETVLNGTDLAPFAALIQVPGSVALGGRATGTAVFAGNLRSRDASGNLVFSTDNLQGEARFTELSVMVEETMLTAAKPVVVRFSPSAVTVDNAQFTGSGSDININGTLALTGAGENSLAVNGRVNLRVLNALSSDQFFGGLAEVNVRFNGTAANPRLLGSATLANAAFTTILSNERINFTNIRGNVRFNSNFVQIDSLEARLGGGRVVITGGAALENLSVRQFRFAARADDFTAPLPSGFRTFGDANIQVVGERVGEQYNTFISGNIVAQRTEYTENIDLADFISQRRGGSIGGGSGGSSLLGVTRLNISIEGRDALVVRNNIADVTGSISLRITGDVEEPIIAGRVTANGGTVTLLNDQRYDVQRATIDFPGTSGASPIVNLQAEGEINGYQVFLGASGPISEPDALVLNLRSNPSLPQADVVSLITTGDLAGAEAGIGVPALAGAGLNTAANVVTDALINEPLSRATDRLFGLNRFNLDPVLSGDRGRQPGARLTVGRQINRNLSITYSTNLSNDQNQVVAFEYRVSNRVSFVAQFEQAANNNVVQRDNNFSFEVRFRRRF